MGCSLIVVYSLTVVVDGCRRPPRIGGEASAPERLRESSNALLPPIPLGFNPSPDSIASSASIFR